MYALNIRKGTVIQHPEITLPGLVAVPVTDKVANQVRNIINVVVFDKVMGIVEKEKKELYGINKNTLETKKVT